MPVAISTRESVLICYVVENGNDPCIIESSAHVELNDKNRDKVEFYKMNSYPAIGERALAK